MDQTLAHAPDFSVEPSPEVFAAFVERAYASEMSLSPEELAARDARISASVSRLVAFRAARGRGYQ